MIKQYIVLTKPGIIIGNLITTIGGFFLASRGDIRILPFIASIFGISFVIASACVFNNMLDVKIDKLMQRTQKRPLVTGVINMQSAFIFGLILGILGFSSLYFGTNPLSAFLAFVGFVFYVFIYGFAKRHTKYSTLVGSIPGAIPIVVGYCAFTNTFDISAFLLFMTMVVWQMPHFYAISIFRHNDYKSASLPVLSNAVSIPVVKKHMLIFACLYVFFLMLLSVEGVTGYVFFAVMGFLALFWVYMGVKGFKAESVIWARKMFGFSLLTLLMFSLMLSLDMVLH